MSNNYHQQVEISTDPKKEILNALFQLKITFGKASKKGLALASINSLTNLTSGNFYSVCYYRIQNTS